MSQNKQTTKKKGLENDVEFFEPKFNDVREYLEAKHPRISELKKIKERHNISLSAFELLDAIKFLKYEVKKNIRNLKTTLIKNNNFEFEFDDDKEALFKAKIEHELLAFNIKFKTETIDNVIKIMRAELEYCPLREKLNSFKWDGVKRLNKEYLNKYFSDKDLYFTDCLLAFLVGTVGRLHNPKFQSPVWIFAGGQGLGKSYFASWLTSPFGDIYYSEKAIDPDDKDSMTLCCEKLIIEIPEAGATFKKDRETLKRHFTQAYFDIRNPYGKYSITRPHLANYIATLNISTLGILKDPTGNRRFMICELEDKIGINRDYSKDINPEQLFAEAFLYYKENIDKLTNNYEFCIDVEKRNKINLRFTSRPLEYDFLEDLIEVTDNKYDKVRLTDIVKTLLEKTGEKMPLNLVRNIVIEFILEQYNLRDEMGKIDGSNVRHYKGIKLIK
jgi:predicted P-loop ATPase